MKVVRDKRYSDITTFKVGGRISELIYPETSDEAVTEYDGCDIVGNGSNILASDTDHRKVICTKQLDDISKNGNNVVFQCGVMNYNAINYCLDNGLTGLEFLCGIPGTIGGAVMTNAGFYGNCIGDYVRWVTCIKDGELWSVHKDDIQFERRYCSLRDDNVLILDVCLSLPDGDNTYSKRLIREYSRIRSENQKHKYPSAGGVFKNYKLLANKIDCRIKRGGATLYVDQPNFIFNCDNASFGDVESIIYYLTNIVPELELEIDIKR